MQEHVTLLAAFGAGLLSFISPCVLPLIPGYLSYISGLSLEQMRGAAAARAGSGATAAAVAVRTPPDARRRIVVAALAFICGFSLVFIALGASATLVGQFMMRRLDLFSRVAGVIVILFGLHTMGVLRIEWLYQEKRIQTSPKPVGLMGALLVGVAFAFGWTPCIGPILAGILALAATQETAASGVRLLSAYSLGLGVPFLAAALAVDRFFGTMPHIRRHFHKIELASGALLIVIGLLIFTNKFTILAQWLTPYLPVY